jgi:hypothetical protein
LGRPEDAEGRLKTPTLIREEIAKLSPLANDSSFVEVDLARTLLHCLQWVLQDIPVSDDLAPSRMFGWVKVNLHQLEAEVRKTDAGLPIDARILVALESMGVTQRKLEQVRKILSTEVA